MRRQFFEPFLIGRDPGNEIQLADRRVSRIHAVVYAEDTVWKIRDIGSSNGTFLGEKKVSKSDLPASCQLRFHEEGPTVEVSIHNMEKPAVTRNVGEQAESE